MFKDDHPAVVTAPPRHRWRFWLLLVGVPVSVLILSGVVWMVRASSSLQAAIDEADRLDPRWRLDEIQADRITPPAGENAADRTVTIRSFMPAGWPGAELIPLFDDLPPERQLNSEQIAALTDRLGHVRPALAEARLLADMPRGRHTVVYPPNWISVDLNGVQEVRRIGVLLKFDVLEKSQSDDPNAAVRSCVAVLNAGCSIGDEPSLFAQMARISLQNIATSSMERIIAQGKPSDEDLTTFAERLGASETEPLLLYGMRGERAGAYQLFENVRAGVIAPQDAFGVIDKSVALDEILPRLPGYVAVQEAWHLRFMNEVVEIVKRPPEQWAEPMDFLEAKADEQAKAGQVPRMAFSWLVAARRMSIVFRRNHANLRCTLVAIAAERYRRTNGHWPTTPDGLVQAGLLKSVPGDPFAAGRRIKLARRVDGITVYSVGQNGVDDGGDLTRDANDVEADLGFRLWDVAARRQPPLPPKP
jgi:hypothetical protein